MTVITRVYEGHAIAYRQDGWFNATQAASKYGKRPIDWLRLDETVSYMAALERSMVKSGKVGSAHFGLVKTSRGGTSPGTWLHPKLAVAFARWLSVDFAVWCDEQIDGLIRERDDWRKLRHGCASTNKVVNEILMLTRAEQGKGTAPHHYMNEAKLVNHVISGEFKGLDRDSLSTSDLDLLAHIETRNAVLIGRGLAYDQRKAMLRQYAMDWRLSHTAVLEA